jgi:hypothetical protein
VQPPCDCGAYPGRQHREHCTVVQVSPYPYKPHPTALPPADSTPPPTSEPTEADDEALLGPCTCGQAPTCQPDCFRVNG